MKKRIFIIAWLAVLVMAGLCSCLNIGTPPESVELDGTEWKLCYGAGVLYPNSDTFNDIMNGDIGEKHGSHKFYPVDGAEYDCRIVYGSSSTPLVYFKADEFDSAKAYYDDPDNYSYYCMVGNLHDVTDHRVYEISEVDTEKFEELYAFALENSYDPFSGAKDDGDFRVLTHDGKTWTDGELRFYKTSKDGALLSDKGIIFRIEEGKLVLLYYYYGETEMYVRDVPEELGNYFIGLVKGLE